MHTIRRLKRGWGHCIIVGITLLSHGIVRSRVLSWRRYGPRVIRGLRMQEETSGAITASRVISARYEPRYIRGR
jgi:hypothetical protein